MHDKYVLSMSCNTLLYELEIESIAGIKKVPTSSRANMKLPPLAEIESRRLFTGVMAATP
jgi:hypothetical protein